MRVPWTARRSNQSILKEISPECSLEGLVLKLKLQYLRHLMWRTDSLEKTLMLGGIGGRRRKGRQRMRCWMASLTWWTGVWVNSGSWWRTGRPGALQFMGSQRVGHDWATELNSCQNVISKKMGGVHDLYKVLGEEPDRIKAGAEPCKLRYILGVVSIMSGDSGSYLKSFTLASTYPLRI